MVEKQNSERAALRQRMEDMAKQHGVSIQEVFGKARKGKGSVASKYRDTKNPENTWTGRGRMPRWMVAATKGGKAKKEDFLISAGFNKGGTARQSAWRRSGQLSTASSSN
jgi:DNA-binding protein H-NS